jgi:very-short-patch-repair endonuclease
VRFTKKQTLDFIEKHKIFFDGTIWLGERTCPRCEKNIKYSSTERFYVIRNIKLAINKKTLCLKCSTSGKNNPFFGKKHTSEVKKKISKSRKGKGCGANNSMNNPIHRQKISQILKQKYKNGELESLKEIQKKTMIQSRIDGKLKNAPISKLEIEIQNKLREKNIDFEPQFKINSKPFDFFIKEYNLLVEFNGDYFHANPTKYDANYLNKKKKMFAWELWKIDEIKKQEAIDNGYNFLTIWESDYKKNKNDSINKIINYAKQ